MDLPSLAVLDGAAGPRIWLAGGGHRHALRL
jgi:hypothetical protein